jgi:hypothetical protein
MIPSTDPRTICARILHVRRFVSKGTVVTFAPTPSFPFTTSIASRTLARGALQSKTQKVLATPHALIADHRVWHPCVIGARNVRDCVFVIRADSRSLRVRSHPADYASKRTTESASHDRTRSSRSTTRGMAVRAEPSTTTPITSCTAVGEIATSASDRRARWSFPISPDWRRDQFHSSSLSCASAHVCGGAATSLRPRRFLGNRRDD